MKQNNTKPTKKKVFLKQPIYTGGKKAFIEFISNNLTYPEDAINNKIEGLVHVVYEVNDEGDVSDIRIKNGIGHGCDEEAIRIISLLKYEPVRNRGLRMTSKINARILFKLPVEPVTASENSVTINYSITEKKDTAKNIYNSYSYTINLG